MTVYTCIIGNYDYLKPFLSPQKDPRIRFICYTDQSPESEVFDLVREDNPWEIRQIKIMDLGPSKTARWYKINFHEHIDDEFSMWIDGTFFINTDVARWVRRRFLPDFTVIKHPFDDCAYVDAFACMSSGKGDRWKLLEQIQDYKKAGLPEHNGLIASGILMRNKTKHVIEICRKWWEEVEKYSDRDQVGFGMASFGNNGFNVIRWDYTTQREFIHCPHRHKRWADEHARKLAGV